MIYILEGTDCAGKTTLAKRIAEKYNAEYMHFSAPPIEDGAYLYFANALTVSLSQGKDVVCDRHCIGEIIYAKIKGTPSTWKNDEYDAMLKILAKNGCIIFFVWEYKDILFRRYDERGETFVTKEEMMKVQRMFHKEIRRIAKVYGIPCFKINDRTQNARLIL